MKIRKRLGIAAGLGMLAALGLDLGLQARAQVNPVSPIPFGNYNTFFTGQLPQPRIPAEGAWVEIITVTPRWMVVQNQIGQQFPIQSDRIGQFLVRWPYAPSMLTPQSMIEVTGPEVGSNTIIADHVDVYEANAQQLVSPTVTNLFGANPALPYGNFQTISSYGMAQHDPFGAFTYMSNEEFSIPNRVHVVGHSTQVGGDPIRIAGFGLNWYTVQPSTSGLTMTQVTLGSNSYARRGDLVYLVPLNVGPRGLDVSQLVLYKKIPLRSFQP